MQAHPEHLPKAAVFAAVVRGGSFSAGAKALGLARSTASAHVAALEDALGVRLLERTTRKIRLTEEGALLFQRIDQVLQAWDDARAALEGRTGAPTGTLRVTLSTGLAASLAPLCGELLAEFPRLDVDLVVDDRLRDIVADGIDVALRMAPLEDSSLGCRKLGSTPTILVGAPDRMTDEADTLAAIQAHDWVGHSEVFMTSVNLEDSTKTVHTVRPRYRAWASTGDAQVALISSGCGIGLLPRLLAQPDLDAGRLVRVFPSWRGRDIPIYAVYSRSAHRPARVTQFLERLGRQLSELGRTSP